MLALPLKYSPGRSCKEKDNSRRKTKQRSRGRISRRTEQRKKTIHLKKLGKHKSGAHRAIERSKGEEECVKV